MARIEPLSPPYEPEVAEQLARMMPPGVAPIALFRMFARNVPMARGMSGWAGYYLTSQLRLSMREREIVIDRTCARTACEYEWSVHVLHYADRVGLPRPRSGRSRTGRPATTAGRWSGSASSSRRSTSCTTPTTSPTAPGRPRRRLHRAGTAGPAAADRLVPRDQLRRPGHPAARLEPGAPTFAAFAGRAP